MYEDFQIHVTFCTIYMQSPRICPLTLGGGQHQVIKKKKYPSLQLLLTLQGLNAHYV